MGSVKMENVLECGSFYVNINKTGADKVLTYQAATYKDIDKDCSSLSDMCFLLLYYNDEYFTLHDRLHCL